MFRKNKNVRVCTLGKGELFGEMALIDRHPRSATVTALEETHVVNINYDWISTKFKDSDPVIKHLLLLIMKRFRDTQNMHKDKIVIADKETNNELDQTFSDTQENLIEHVRIASSIKEAMERDEFQLYYQPITKSCNNQLVGCEALIRWLHPEFGMMLPVKFLNIIEDTDQMLPIGIWVLERACRDLHTLSKETHNSQNQTPLFISVNLSARQLTNTEHMTQIVNIIHNSGIEPSRFKMEITETILIDEQENAQQVLSTLRNQGLRISLDDFGTGYSSLSHLQKFQVDDIKIDKSFVNNMLSDHGSMQIVRASIELAKALDLEVVAEGVENKAVFEQLIDMNCHYCQGYYFAKPLSLAETIKYMK